MIRFFISEISIRFASLCEVDRMEVCLSLLLLLPFVSNLEEDHDTSRENRAEDAYDC